MNAIPQTVTLTLNLPLWLHGLLAEEAQASQTTIADLVSAYIGRGLYAARQQVTAPSDPPLPPTVGDGAIDTVIVPAKEENFNTMFLNGYWNAINMGEAMREQVKYIAVYRTSTRSITHIARCTSIVAPDTEEEKAAGKFKLLFTDIEEISPVVFTGGKGNSIQGREYTTRGRLLRVHTLDELRDRN